MTEQRREAPAGGDVGLAAVPTAAREFQARAAGIVSRLIAAVVDLGVLFVLIGFAYLGAAGLTFLWSPRHAHLPHPMRSTVFVAGAILLVLYLTAAWTTSGRTYGDQLLGLRVVGPRQHRIHVARAFLRALVCVVFPAGLLWAAVNSARRSVADLVLNTSVVYDWTARIPDD